MIKRIEFLDANVIVLEQTEAAASAILCQQMQQLLDAPTEIQHVDEVLKLLQVMTGDARYKRIFGKKKEGVHSMCDVAERLEKMGWEKGIKQGIEQGIEQGSIKKSIKVYKNLLNLGFGREEARKIAEVPESFEEKEIKRLAELQEDAILEQ